MIKRLPSMWCWNFLTAAATAKSSLSKVEYRDSEVGKSMAEEGEWLEPPSMVLVEDSADGGVGGVCGDG